jgi:hypothetical protein
LLPRFEAAREDEIAEEREPIELEPRLKEFVLPAAEPAARLDEPIALGGRKLPEFADPALRPAPKECHWPSAAPELRAPDAGETAPRLLVTPLEPVERPP